MSRLLVALTVVICVVGLSATIQAMPQSATGTFQVTSLTPTAPPEQRGHTCFIEADVVFTFEGTLEGAFAASITIMHAGECGQAGPEAFRSVGTFTGTVAGVAGTFDFNFQGHIDAAGNAVGELAIHRGTGDLATLHGKLTLSGRAGVGGTYEGFVNFAP